MRKHLWTWLGEVVTWINEEHTWRVERMIPMYWAQHPHVLHELATLACLRLEAMHAVTADPLEEGHRYAPRRTP